MAIYIIIFSLFLSASIFEAGGLKKEQASWIFVALAGLLVLFVGLRYNTGADWNLYKQIFNGTLSNTEYGYLLLNKTFNTIFGNYYVLQFSATLFFVFSVCRLYKKEAPYPIAALTLLMCFMLFNILMAQIRQSISIGIIVLFSNYIFERKPIRFLLVIFVASFFHTSAITAIPLYFLYKNYGKALPVVLILVANIFYFYPESLKTIVLQIAPILPEDFSTKAVLYMESLFAQKVQFNTGLFYLSQLAIILLIVLFVKTNNNKTAFFVNSLAMFAIIKAFSSSVYILGRLESYYLVYGVVAFTYIWDLKIKQIQLSSSKLVFATILLLFFCVLPVRDITSTKISNLTNRPVNYGLSPYYNCISHPPKATLRKDWNQ